MRIHAVRVKWIVLRCSRKHSLARSWLTSLYELLKQVKLIPEEMCCLNFRSHKSFWCAMFWRTTLETGHKVVYVFLTFNHLKTKRRLLYLKTQFVPRGKHFHLGYKNQSVYAVSGTSRCLFSDKYKTHKYSVGTVYNCWTLNCRYIT